VSGRCYDLLRAIVRVWWLEGRSAALKGRDIMARSMTIIAPRTLAVALLVVWWRETEPTFRFVGVALQLLGLATVAVGIRNTRALFGRPSMRKRFVEWWRRRPRRGHTASTCAGIGMEYSSRETTFLSFWIFVGEA
jgi:hypothetical protein